MIRSTSSELRCGRAALALVVALLPAAPVSAQDPNTPDPAAAALFRSGRELVEQGQWKAGCEKFEQSLARYPAASTLLNLARCREHDGKTASAWALYQRARVLARDTPGERRRQELEQIAEEGMTRLEPRLARIQVTVRAPKPPPPGLRVEEGGKDLPIGTAVPMDAGSLELRASAPGFATWKRKVDLVDGETMRVDVELLPSASTTSSSAAPAAASSGPTRQREASPAGPPAWVWIAGAGGLVLAGASVAFAVDAKATADGLEERCGADLFCDEDLDYDPDDANARKNRDIALSIALGSTALVALGLATYGLIGASRSPAAMVVVPTPRGASAVLRARY